MSQEATLINQKIVPQSHYKRLRTRTCGHLSMSKSPLPLNIMFDDIQNHSKQKHHLYKKQKLIIEIVIILFEK